MQVQLRQAARAWLTEVIQHVPVYSGESLASLLPLAGYLHRAIDIVPSENWMKRPPGRTSLGVDIGESRGRYSFSAENFIYSFTFSTDVPQFLINEFNVGLGQPPLIHPTPWLSLEAGQEAFNQYLYANLKQKIPKVSHFVIITKNLGL